MTERHQLLGQPVHDPLGPAIELWWNGLGEWRDLRNPHDRLLHGCQPRLPKGLSSPAQRKLAASLISRKQQNLSEIYFCEMPELIPSFVVVFQSRGRPGLRNT